MRKPKRLSPKTYLTLLLVIVSVVAVGTLSYYLDLPKDVPSKQVLSRALFYTEDSHLMLYDSKTGKSYPVWRDDGASGGIIEDEDSNVNYSYFNPVALGGHSVAFYTQTEDWNGKDGKHTYDGNISIVNLKTGKQKIILEDIVGDMPGNLCCSVSPDGKTLVVPLKEGKLVFYSEGGKKTQEIDADIRPLPEMEDRGRRDNFGLAMLSGGYPRISWLDNTRLVAATGSSLRYDTTNAGHRDINSLVIINTTTGKQTFIKGTSNASIPWFDVWQNNVVYASLDGQTDSDYQVPRLYKLSLDKNAKPQEIKAAAAYPHDNFVLDTVNGILYTQTVQDNFAVVRDVQTADKVVAINLQTDSRKIYPGVTFPIYKLVNPGLLVSENGTVSPEGGYSSPGYTYRLSTGQVTRIY